MHYRWEFTCKRGITLATHRRDICCSFGYKYLSQKYLLQTFYILHQLQFNANEVSFNFLRKFVYFYTADYPAEYSLSYFLLFLQTYCISAKKFALI